MPAGASGRGVTVFGSLHHDIIVAAPALPRLGETVPGSAWAPKSGGKGLNQAVAAARCGARAAMVGAVGEDAFGQALLSHLDREGVDRRGVRIAPGSPTGMSVAITEAGGDYGAVIVSGVNLTLGEEDVRAAASLWPETAILILQNEVPEAANLLAARAAATAGARVVLNAAPARPVPPALGREIDILVVNAIEAQMLAGGGEIRSLADAEALAEQLSRTYRCVVVTAGGHGLAYAGRGLGQGVIPAVPVTVVSTHGAGDMFVGTFAAALAAGSDIVPGLALANRAAAAHVSTVRAL